MREGEQTDRQPTHGNGREVATTVSLEAPRLEDNQLAHRIVDIASDRKAEDIVLLDIRPVAFFANYFVIMTGTTDRHITSLTTAISETLEEEGIRPLQVEGTPAAGWVLMDYGDVVVHIFSPAQRSYYNLEKLWSEAPIVVRMQ